MADWYETNLVDTGRSAALWVLVGFLVTYAVTRFVTRRIRARAESGARHEGTVKDVYIGGVHIHHQVWGILLVLTVGLLEFRFNPDSPWQEVLAVLFGMGAALTLDEFALWLHLEDVYWTEEGRKSIDAVMVALAVGVALLVGTSPVGLDQDSAQAQGLLATSVAVVIHIGYTVICLLKGKLAIGLIGLPIPFVAFVGAVRIAKPESFWARRYYRGKQGDNGKKRDSKMAKAHKRFGAGHQQRVERLRDVFSGGS